VKINKNAKESSTKVRKEEGKVKTCLMSKKKLPQLDVLL